MATEHKDIAILSAEPSGKGIIDFSNGTSTLFRTHFLYEVRDADDNVALTSMSDEDLWKGFGE